MVRKPENGSTATSVLPEGRKFAFTILDDTDDSTVENTRPIYDLLYELGFRTTKTVWPLSCPEGSEIYFAGATLETEGYLEFCLELVERGFEITWHCATMESSGRERTLRGLERFRSVFGYYPRIHVNHGQNRENMYWGHSRYQTGLVRNLSRLLKPRRPGERGFDGECEESSYFWGDRCLEHCRFVRNFTFRELNTLKADPYTPYRLPSTRWVNYWFSTSDAPDVNAFNRLMTHPNIEKLVAENGVCILSTHLGKGFVRDGKVDRNVDAALRTLAEHDGWFVPVSEILEHLLKEPSRGRELDHLSLTRLELAHVYDRLRGLGQPAWTAQS